MPIWTDIKTEWATTTSAEAISEVVISAVTFSGSDIASKTSEVATKPSEMTFEAPEVASEALEAGPTHLVCVK